MFEFDSTTAVELIIVQCYDDDTDVGFSSA